jgi:hypothetical protein
VAVTKFSSGSSFKNLTKYDDFLAGNAAYDPAAFVSIASATGDNTSGTITFSSIPSTYTSLQIRGNITSNSNDSVYVRLNSDTGSNYAYHRLRGVGSGAATAAGFATQTFAEIMDTTDSSPATGFILDIRNYASNSRYKTLRTFYGRDINSTGRIALYSGLWQSTSAVTSISIIMNSGNFNTGTTISLYGIKGA